MATLIVADAATTATVLPHHGCTSAVAALRDWLAGQWGALFSNPEHFAPHPSTPAGFITLLADDFAGCGVKPIKVAGSANAAASWLDYTGTDSTEITVAVAGSNRGVVDLAERTLAMKIGALVTPFVMVIDANARCRSTITYRTRQGERSRTIQDVLSVVQVLQRGESGVRRYRRHHAAAC